MLKLAQGGHKGRLNSLALIWLAHSLGRLLFFSVRKRETKCKGDTLEAEICGFLTR